MYRLTKKAEVQRTTWAQIRRARDATRMDGPAPDYPQPLPELRRRIVIEDFDFERRVHVLEFFRTNRVDCYKVVADGKVWKERIGWSQALAGLRKSLPRVGAI